MRSAWNGVVALGLLTAALSTAWAAQGDRTRPMAIENEGGGVYNAQTRRTEFSGKVLLTQGTLQMRANRLEAQQRDDGSVFVLAQGAPAEPVRFEQARDVPGERIAGQAERIEYDSAADTVRFVGGATVRRLRQGQVADEVTGAVIVYNSRAETFAVEGGQTAPQPNGRVRVILMPRDAASAPAAEPSVRLQPTPALSPGSAPR
ncbi:MAG: lipopolysaccharide transport periplasmic protein LptA [Inhella sp.]|jgi:lipopolysaccharide export system protein LptA|uniref:lipopolysaccharide transport periplasmic protein LptA n=1 Tax=Inhella sp. TaxID=1921806 RepID=UPI0022C8A5B1|nr:lipopolysaccharide transport periplasmic protein LptA [Inhella sp.]MCZ8234059.1 lipopolysaccharide transport periplasmic protein LptA [Inhella sp.]